MLVDVCQCWSRTRGKWSAEEAGVSGGGRLRLGAMQGSFHYRLARPATSERGAAVLQAAASAADLSESMFSR